MIEGSSVKQIAVHPDTRGRLFEILRADDEAFAGFGQVYITTSNPGIVKAWHYHRKQTDFFCCVRGMMRLVLFDDREGSPTRGEVNEYVMGQHRLLAVRIPPEVWHGFQCIGAEEAMVVNVVSRPYDPVDPDEYRIDPHDNDIPFDWTIRDR